MDYTGKKIEKYIVKRLIGEGGMASVYEAEHEVLGTKAAIKILNPMLSANADVRARFLNEAKMMASFQHTNITKIIDFEESDQFLAIIMEFLEGQDLSERIERGPKMSEKEIIDIFKQILSAFQYAHERGVIHRDIKPSNIYILPNGKVKILDFGIAKLFGQGKEKTQTGTQMGTPIYMSPEQVKGDKSIDHRSDIYSLGVTLYYMLNGKPPYDSNTISQFDIFSKIVHEPLPELSIDSPLKVMIYKACEKEREERFQSCLEWLDYLNEKKSANNDNVIELNSNKNVRNQNKKTFESSDKVKISFSKKVIISSGIIILSLMIYYFFFNTTLIFQKKYEGNYKSWDFNQNNVIGVKKIEDTKGRVYIKITNIDEDNIKIEEFNCQNVLQQTILLSKKEGKISTISYKNLNGFVYRIRKFEHNSEEMFETAKNKGVNEFLPCKGIKHKFKGDLNYESIYIGMDGQPSVGPDGYSVIKYSRFEDEKRWGLEKQTSFHDLNDLPLESSDGYHKIIYERDSEGNIVKESYWGKENNAVKNISGVFATKCQYNELDQITQEEYFDSSNEKIKNLYGIVKEKYEYNNNNMVKVTRLGLNDQIVEHDEVKVLDGASIIKIDYDERGNRISTSFYDKNEKPINSSTGYFILRQNYDENDNLLSRSFFDKGENNMTDFEGIHKYEWGYNDKGLVKYEKFYNTNIDPVEDYSSRVFIIKLNYDDEGKEISQSYWRTENEKMSRWSGIHEYINKFNDQGQIIEVISMDENGNLKLESSGGSRTIYEYDKLGRLSKRKVFDNMIPVLVLGEAQVANYHEIKYEYNNHNKVASISYFDTNENSTNATVNNNDYVHKILFEYQGNQVISQKWFRNQSEIPVKIIDCLENEAMGSYGIGMYKLN